MKGNTKIFAWHRMFSHEVPNHPLELHQSGLSFFVLDFPINIRYEQDFTTAGFIAKTQRFLDHKLHTLQKLTLMTKFFVQAILNNSLSTNLLININFTHQYLSY